MSNEGAKEVQPSSQNFGKKIPIYKKGNGLIDLLVLGQASLFKSEVFF